MFGRRTNNQTTMVDAPDELPAEDPVAAAPLPDVIHVFQPKTPRARKSIEQLLLERGLVTEEQLLQAKNVQVQTPGKQIPQILLTMNAASEAQILDAQAECLGLPCEQPDRSEVDVEAFAMLPSDFIRKHLALPLRVDGKALIV